MIENMEAPVKKIYAIYLLIAIKIVDINFYINIQSCIIFFFIYYLQLDTELIKMIPKELF